MTARNEEFPFVRRILELIEIKSSQVVEEVPFDLATKYVEPRSQDVQGMAITS